jgi:hypothetical protein
MLPVPLARNYHRSLCRHARALRSYRRSNAASRGSPPPRSRRGCDSAPPRSLGSSRRRQSRAPVPGGSRRAPLRTAPSARAFPQRSKRQGALPEPPVDRESRRRAEGAPPVARARVRRSPPRPPRRASDDLQLPVLRPGRLCRAAQRQLRMPDRDARVARGTRRAAARQPGAAGTPGSSAAAGSPAVRRTPERRCRAPRLSPLTHHPSRIFRQPPRLAPVRGRTRVAAASWY